MTYASYKLYALRRIRKYLTEDQAKLFCNAFMKSQFNYAQIIWKFFRKNQYLKIQKIHRKPLRLYSTVMMAMMNYFK